MGQTNRVQVASSPIYKFILIRVDEAHAARERDVSPKNLSMLWKLMKLGLRVGLITKDSLESITPFVEILRPNGVLVLHDGARIWDIGQRRFVYDSEMPTDHLEFLAQYFKIQTNQILVVGEKSTEALSENFDYVLSPGLVP